MSAPEAAGLSEPAPLLAEVAGRQVAGPGLGGVRPGRAASGESTADTEEGGPGGQHLLRRLLSSPGNELLTLQPAQCSELSIPTSLLFAGSCLTLTHGVYFQTFGALCFLFYFIY